jgi:hypothetical protein
MRPPAASADTSPERSDSANTPMIATAVPDATISGKESVNRLIWKHCIPCDRRNLTSRLRDER